MATLSAGRTIGVPAARSAVGYLPPRLVYWIPLAIGLSVLAALVYIGLQQELRQGADDPQIQLAEDGAASLQAGTQPQTIVGSSTVDVSRSLAPFMIVYDASGNVLASSGQLNGQPPTLPPGVLASASQSGEDRITWQPQPGVRLAAVIVPSSGAHSGFVLAARSLREVEKREDYMLQATIAAWIGAVVLSALAWFGIYFIADRLRSAS